MNVKNEIIRLRKKGLSYNEIAITLNISKDHVAKVCKRNQDLIDANTSICKKCGTAFDDIKSVAQNQEEYIKAHNTIVEKYEIENKKLQELMLERENQSSKIIELKAFIYKVENDK
jgi:transcriptional regulator